MCRKFIFMPWCIALAIIVLFDFGDLSRAEKIDYNTTKRSLKHFEHTIKDLEFSYLKGNFAEDLNEEWFNSGKTLLSSDIPINEILEKSYISNKEISRRINAIVNPLIGRVKYQWGHSNLNYMDCSAFVKYCIDSLTGRRVMPRTVQKQALMGQRIDFSEIRPGDVVFFDADNRPTRKGVDHSGIALDSISFVHCSSPSDGISINRFSQYPYPVKFVRRLIY